MININDDFEEITKKFIYILEEELAETYGLEQKSIDCWAWELIRNDYSIKLCLRFCQTAIKAGYCSPIVEQITKLSLALLEKEFSKNADYLADYLIIDAILAQLIELELKAKLN